MAGKVFSVLVTGANRGIGLEFIRQLASVEEPPQYIFAGCRNPGKSTELKKLSEAAPQNTKIKILQLDVTNDKHIEHAAKEIEATVGDRGLNLLINNAGILEREGSLIPTVKRAVVNDHFNINVTSAILVTQAMVPLLKKAASHISGDEMSIGRAAVVNISSELASLTYSTTGSKNYGFSYKCSKVALNMFTKCLSNDLHSDGILCVTLSPGWVKTDMGGPQAQLTLEQSGGMMLNTICKLNKTHSGAFLNRNGETVPV